MNSGEVSKDAADAADAVSRVPTAMLKGSVERLNPVTIDSAFALFLGTLASLQQTVQQAEISVATVAHGAEDSNAKLFQALFGADSTSARDAIAMGYAMSDAATAQPPMLGELRGKLADMVTAVVTAIGPLREEYGQIHSLLVDKTDVVHTSQQETVAATRQYIAEITGQQPESGS